MADLPSLSAQAETRLLDAAGSELQSLRGRLAGAEPPLARRPPASDALALLHVELDGLSSLQARLGAGPAQDLLALALARLIKGARRGDRVRRCEDGARFDCLLCGVAGSGQGLAIAERLLRRLGTPWQLNDERLQLRASIGLAVGPASGLAGLQRAAEAALHTARRQPGSVVLAS